MNEEEKKIIKENARDYTKDAIFCVNDAFKWVFKSGDYECSRLVFEALESIKIAFANMSECDKIWNKPSTRKETLELLKMADNQIKEIIDILQTS